MLFRSFSFFNQALCLLPGHRALGVDADELGLEGVGDLRTSVGRVVPELRLVPPIGDAGCNMSALSALRAPPQLSPGHWNRFTGNHHVKLLHPRVINFVARINHLRSPFSTKARHAAFDMSETSVVLFAAQSPLDWKRRKLVAS